MRRTPAEAQFEVAAALRVVREAAEATKYATVVARDAAGLLAGQAVYGVGLVGIVADETGELNLCWPVDRLGAS